MRNGPSAFSFVMNLGTILADWPPFKGKNILPKPNGDLFWSHYPVLVPCISIVDQVEVRAQVGLCGGPVPTKQRLELHRNGSSYSTHVKHWVLYSRVYTSRFTSSEMTGWLNLNSCSGTAATQCFLLTTRGVWSIVVKGQCVGIVQFCSLKIFYGVTTWWNIISLSKIHLNSSQTTSNCACYQLTLFSRVRRISPVHLVLIIWGDSDPVHVGGGQWGAIVGTPEWADVHKGYIVLIKG